MVGLSGGVVSRMGGRRGIYRGLSAGLVWLFGYPVAGDECLLALLANVLLTSRSMQVALSVAE